MYARVYIGGVLICLLIAIGISEASSPVEYQRCHHHGRSYRVGSRWKSGSLKCRCDRDLVARCDGKYGKCDGSGDVHYHSFDRRKFDFQGLCRYVLARDCCNGTFSIEIEQNEYFGNPAVSWSDKFTIRFGNDRHVTLEKVQKLKVDGSAVGFPFLYDDPQDTELRCEQIGAGIMVTLKAIDVRFWWDWQFYFYVLVHPSYKDKLCGLCGDYNGDPGNDLSLTPHGEPVVTIPQWGASWMTLWQPKRCSCIDIGDHPLKCKEHREFMSLCEKVMMGPIFSQCRRRVNPQNFINDCHTELCACAISNQKKGCICSGVPAYVKACKDKGVVIGPEWKLKYDCGVCKDPHTGVIYEHGSSWRYKCEIRTCVNGKIVSKNGRCCTFGKKHYLNGQTWRVGCNQYTCRNGSVSSQRVKSCCYVGRRQYLSGQTWRVGCVQYTCRNGRVSSQRVKSCCLYRGKLYSNGRTLLTYHCYHLKCGNGVWRWYFTCCYFKGKWYLSGQSWRVGCVQYTCRNRRVSSQPVKPCAKKDHMASRR